MKRINEFGGFRYILHFCFTCVGLLRKLFNSNQPIIEVMKHQVFNEEVTVILYVVYNKVSCTGETRFLLHNRCKIK